MQPATDKVSTPRAANRLAPHLFANRRIAAVLFSMVVHGCVIALVLMVATAVTKRLIEPVAPPVRTLLEIAGGAHAVKIPLPEAQTAAHTRKPTLEAEASKKTILPVEKTVPKLKGGGSPKTPRAGDGSGMAMAGNGSDAEDAHPAFPIFAPRPPVSDRSLLPQSEQKIVVDVNVDALGQVVSEKLVKGLHSKLDQIVLNIVMTWRFQPATVNGNPVPTEAELIFPFNQSYPVAEA